MFTDTVLSVASNDNLPIHEDKVKGVYVKGMKEVYVADTDEVYDVMRIGGDNRVVASTSKFIFFETNILKRFTSIMLCNNAKPLYFRHER